MNKPDPTISRLNNIRAETALMTMDLKSIEDLKRQPPLMFTKEDINETTSALDRLLRKFFVKHSITEAYFAERYKLFALHKLGMDLTQASNNRSNLRKALKDGHITYNRFQYAIENVLGYSLEDLILCVADEEGAKSTLALSDKTTEAASSVD